ASILLICARILAIVPPDTSRLAKGSNDLMKAAITTVCLSTFLQFSSASIFPTTTARSRAVVHSHKSIL
ncbi:hypothetical protein PZH41_25055, partial [Phocaeicola vulgatus]|uniref:hypothetical protein n=1 Tax=Phocaeicola vulgatus TaxID=821 RepID=UPI0023B09BEC